MIVAGLTGSIASGKSEVARMLRDLDVPVFDSDDVVHQFYDDGTVAQLLPEKFAAAVSNGNVSRSELSKLLAREPDQFAVLESIVHPLVLRKQEEFIKRQRQAGMTFVVLDIPLLFETGRHDRLDATVVVTAPEALRWHRAHARSGMGQEAFDMLSARQMPQSEKVRLATHVIDNSGDLSDLHHKVRLLFDKLRKSSEDQT